MTTGVGVGANGRMIGTYREKYMFLKADVTVYSAEATSGTLCFWKADACRGFPAAAVMVTYVPRPVFYRAHSHSRYSV